MYSKLLKKGSELYGKKKEVEGQGLKGKWAGSEMGSGGIIAPCSRGRQYQGVDGGSLHRRAAPKTAWAPKPVSKDSTGGPMEGRDGYGKV